MRKPLAATGRAVCLGLLVLTYLLAGSTLATHAYEHDPVLPAVDCERCQATLSADHAVTARPVQARAGGGTAGTRRLVHLPGPAARRHPGLPRAPPALP